MRSLADKDSCKLKDSHTVRKQVIFKTVLIRFAINLQNKNNNLNLCLVFLRFKYNNRFTTVRDLGRRHLFTTVTDL